MKTFAICNTIIRNGLPDSFIQNFNFCEETITVGLLSLPKMDYESKIVEDRISGLKVPVRTRKGTRNIPHTTLAEKIQLLLDDENLRKEIAEGGRKRFLNEYEICKFQNKMLELYQNV